MKVKGTIDITDTWIKKNKTGFMKYMHSYTYNGHTYVVDNFHVVLKPSKEEIEIAELLATKYGKQVYLLPRINIPENIQTPDYLIDGKKFDLKSPRGSGKNTLFNLLRKKSKQSSNFIINFNNCKLTTEQIYIQLNKIYTNSQTTFVNTLILIDKKCKITAIKRKTE